MYSCREFFSLFFMPFCQCVLQHTNPVRLLCSARTNDTKKKYKIDDEEEVKVESLTTHWHWQKKKHILHENYWKHNNDDKRETQTKSSRWKIIANESDYYSNSSLSCWLWFFWAFNSSSLPSYSSVSSSACILRINLLLDFVVFPVATRIYFSVNAQHNGRIVLNFLLLFFFAKGEWQPC